MSKSYGRPFVPAPQGVVEGLQPGQWINLPGEKRKVRFAGYNPDGTASLIYTNGRGKGATVSMVAFRLARGKPLAEVVSRSAVTSTIVRNTVEVPA